MKLKKSLIKFLFTILLIPNVLADTGEGSSCNHGMMEQFFGGMWMGGFNSALISAVLILLIILLIIKIQKQIGKK